MNRMKMMKVLVLIVVAQIVIVGTQVLGWRGYLGDSVPMAALIVIAVLAIGAGLFQLSRIKRAHTSDLPPDELEKVIHEKAMARAFVVGLYVLFGSYVLASMEIIPPSMGLHAYTLLYACMGMVLPWLGATWYYIDAYGAADDDGDEPVAAEV